MAIVYNQEYDYFGDFSEVSESAFDPKNRVLIRLSPDEPLFEWKSKDKCTQDEYVLYTTQIRVDSEIEEPSELIIEVEPGKLFTMGTYACGSPHIAVEMRYMKFDKNVTFHLSGPGVVCISALEVKKQKWFWQVYLCGSLEEENSRLLLKSYKYFNVSSATFPDSEIHNTDVVIWKMTRIDGYKDVKKVRVWVIPAGKAVAHLSFVISHTDTVFTDIKVPIILMGQLSEKINKSSVIELFFRSLKYVLKALGVAYSAFIINHIYMQHYRY